MFLTPSVYLILYSVAESKLWKSSSCNEPQHNYCKFKKCCRVTEDEEKITVQHIILMLEKCSLVSGYKQVNVMYYFSIMIYTQFSFVSYKYVSVAGHQGIPWGVDREATPSFEATYSPLSDSYIMFG